MKFNRYLDRLFQYFERYVFDQDDSDWDNKTARAFGFADFMEDVSNDDLLEISGLTNKRKIKDLRKAAQKSVDCWLCENRRLYYVGK